ncbi:hypothetical protein MAR_031463 [Mya arenaria]|uniref:Uncharacterized protein n=1 Tax=Mya arenaria TaxID=6604 RepID=A0ABY7F6U1_MYAAR|nr:hypothetical protein MAR_031463 [Mya arenaria]
MTAALLNQDFAIAKRILLLHHQQQDIVMSVYPENMVKRVRTSVHRRVIHVNTSIIAFPAIAGISGYPVKYHVLMGVRGTIANRKQDHACYANMGISENIATTLAPNLVDHAANSVNVPNANLDILKLMNCVKSAIHNALQMNVIRLLEDVLKVVHMDTGMIPVTESVIQNVYLAIKEMDHAYNAKTI